MLEPADFYVGTLADARPLSLLLPRNRHEQPMLIAGTSEDPIAVFLGEQHEFHMMSCINNTQWHGLLIPDVRLELAVESIFDPERDGTFAGTIVRDQQGLEICATSDDRFSYGRHRTVPIPIEVPPSHDRYCVAFRTWSVVLGKGTEKRILRTVNGEQRISA